MGRRKRKLRVHRKGFRVKPTTYKRKGKTIHRKGYYVKPTTYMIKDRGKPGRGPKTITVKKGKLHPYSIRKPARVRHAILAKKVKRYGATSVYRALNAQVIFRKHIQPRQRQVFKADRNWVKEKYHLGR